MRNLTTAAAFGLMLAGCLLDPPQYEGTAFMCGDPAASCPDGYLCVDQVCRSEDDLSGPDAGPSDRPDADLPVADAAPPAPDADLPPPDAEPGTITVVLRGSDVYDTYLNEANTDHNYGADDRVRADALPYRTGLLRFDLSSIPPTAVIESAELSVYISEALEDGELIGYRVVEEWFEMEATWDQRKAGVPWATPGAGLGSYAPTPLFTLDARTLGPHTVSLPISTVQAWVAQTVANYGIRWMSSSPDGHGSDFDAAESGSTGPQLRVQYRTAP